ncbi:hypothetical protein GQ57_02015 [Burkholderia sp. MSh2]|uniref:Uncharacterized protein n=1 Tax=Burkholderia paludis TaxID=1506587 RepID=A0A6P2L469_9BURK|nr:MULTISPECIES: hypothetical protein [Burkholderia]KEZ07388.1 hypothetical protein GQ57_02015 [Burkholderia sp. MSh2]CAB3756312.1 hypothetical protein LMG30113_02647 [Burkholderia paludis]VWB61446.1 hypothetical protein BPA30113_02723 [Burkholderia paludis]
MNSPARPISLPGIAALIAAVFTTAPFLYGLYVRSTMSPLPVNVLAMQLSGFFGSLVFRTGLVYLIVRWHGERRDRLAFRRPAWPLAAFALCLAIGQVAQMLMFQTVVRSLRGGPFTLTQIVTLVVPLSAALFALVAWLGWAFVAHLFRNDALPTVTRGNARPRIAGVAAWLFASVMLILVTQAVPVLLDSFDGNPGLAALNYAATVAVPVAVAFAGALFGLPRGLERLHVWRLLGASLAAMATVLLLAYEMLSLLGSVFGIVNLVTGTLPWMVPVGIAVAYWLWFRVFYGVARRETAGTA